MSDIRTNTSVVSSVSMAVIGTTCCALPLVLIALGMGGAMASLVSSVPWLIELSTYKEITFTLTAMVLGYSWWQIRRVTQCDVVDAKRLKWQRYAMWFATGMFVFSVFAAYATVPISTWLEKL
ncbi:MAG: hypothetical protein JKX97_02450 [Candidatus Lindowbacteria bacterium]|nr:hypothetical protein [Candidatus Lindowbacteria bacterium]